MVQTILPYLEFNDKIQLRLVSKVFNDCVKLSLPFLQNKNFVTMNKYKILKSILWQKCIVELLQFPMLLLIPIVFCFQKL